MFILSPLVLPKQLDQLDLINFGTAIASDRVIRQSMSLLRLDAPPSSALWSIDSGRVRCVGLPLRMRGIAVLVGDHMRVLFTNRLLSVNFIMSLSSCNILHLSYNFEFLSYHMKLWFEKERFENVLHNFNLKFISSDMVQIYIFKKHFIAFKFTYLHLISNF